VFNLFWVTLGNMICGGLVGITDWLVCLQGRARPARGAA
jgi:hypothetical protein